MLCFAHDTHFGEICTNRCPEHHDCPHRKLPSYRRVPFLVETADRFVSEIKPDMINGIPTIAYKQYAVAPQAIENGLSEELAPPRDPKTFEIKPSFYTNLKPGATDDDTNASTDPHDLCISRMLKHVLDNRSAKTRIKNL